ncbi:hypothetical protein ACHAW5_000222 [Stephanodiscus triporus]|uniref:Uncharacterized protein n=1 Tax=Stephanodiscus triporus TaxID=2934178 RepID=A0ABD3QNZ8_9STRA
MISSSSMRHGGCINTASWLDCGWRISSRSPASLYSSNDGNVVAVAPTGGDAECPTQLLTSGDDVLVKFWDARESMGSTSPLPGGSATCTPYSSPRMPVNACDELVDSWREMRRAKSSSFVRGGGGNRRYCLPGTVHPLATMSTGHRGNVFHATPVPRGRGRVVTCGADGHLRLHDVAVHATSPVASSAARPTSSSSSSSRGVDSSSIVISPQFLEEPPSAASFLRSGNSPMCFSHHFLSPNVGLVCSERGLLHFDLRLPPRSQKNRSIVPELSGTCKACYPWRLGGNQKIDGEGDDELESAYVFAGGSNDSTVGLYDLRMTGSMSSSSNHVVQKYQPRALRNTSSSVAVAISGIDLSKNKRELLVSYESDQVYTFPIFDGKSQPTLIDIEQSTFTATHADEAVPELATYGGHINRLTFLKSAKYAGPNDEYICTGSDSGHAWIYEKKSGSVVSLIKADTSTCNGIQPHPTLPIFITYGIDSTAKLWRATSPVDMDVDDSDLGRFNYHSKQVTYRKSMVVDQWKRARRKGIVDLESDILSFFPDEISEDDNDDQDHFLSLFIGSRRTSNDAKFIGNDMMNLSNVVSKNYFTCARSIGKGSEEPVKSGVATLKTRVSLIKLRHQADILGLDFDSEMPWIFKHKEHMLIKNDSTAGSSAGDHAVSYGCLADLIPDNPSDWLPFDKLMANPPHTGGMQFNSKYEDYYLDSSADRTVPPISRQVFPDEKEISGDDCAIDIDGVGNEASTRNTLQANENSSSQSETPSYDPVQAWDILLQTVASLKEAGNEALKASLPFMAARRYDKAISYCSVAYIPFPVGTVDFLAKHQYDLSDNGGYEVHWNELLKLLIVVRLNLARVCLVKEINDANGAATQASLALNELKPFITKRGVVRTGKKLVNMRSDEPHSTYFEAKALQAKAYFRLGSAQLVMSEYDEAVKTFEHCVASTKEANLEVDAGVLRKINEAKRCRKEKKETQRKKFKHMFSAMNGT